MSKILAMLACLVCLVGCNDNEPKSDAVTVTRDYQNSQHAISDAIFERERLARELHREMLLAQH